MSDREQAIKLVADLPEIGLDPDTVRDIVESYFADDSPHFMATVRLAERVIQLEREAQEKDVQIAALTVSHDRLLEAAETLVQCETPTNFGINGTYACDRWNALKRSIATTEKLQQGKG